MTRQAIQWWESHDLHHFNERFRIAKEHFTDILEDKAVELALGLKPGQNVVALAMLLNGNLPAKYVQNIVLVDETPKRVAAKLAQMAQEDAEERKAGQSVVARADNVTQIEQMRAKTQA